MQRADPLRSPASQAFQRMVQLAARDPAVCTFFVALVQASSLPPEDRSRIVRQFLSAGAEPDGPS
jgi:hypothetical protein